MSDTLFNIPETLSPRLAWMRDHGITIEPRIISGMDAFRATATDPLGKTIARYDGLMEDEALMKLAELLKIKAWNQP